jgi:predicted KAP-like P-loop ATPase
MKQESPDTKKAGTQAAGVERETYESDRPIKASSEDRFGRWNFAQRVAQVIAKRRDSSSIVVGIHAPWGEGKTSVLHMIIEELEKDDHVLVVRFNPWRFPDESQLLASFFKVLAESFDASLATTGEKIGDIARQYAGILAPISLFGIDASAAVKSAAEVRPAADLEKLKTRIEAILEQSGKRVVVIMDDIDRLDKEEVQAVFKLVKLSADFPHTAYVLAFDEEKVAAALSEKYGGIDAGRNFLEKIIQVSLPLPPASTEALRTMTFEGVEAALNLAEIELSEQHVQKSVLTFVQAFDSRLETPRLAKRFVNGLTFSLPLLKDEVNPVDMILIEGVRTFYPRLYASIRDNADAYLGTHFSRDRGGEDVKEQAKTIINGALEGLSDHDKKAAKVVIQELFPRTGVRGMFNMGSYGAEWDARWAQAKRIAAQRYFHRYFSYGVPPNDVSDRRLDEFLKEIPTRDIEYVVSEISALAANGRAGVLIEKLRAREDTFTEDVARTLASGIARCGEVFPQDRGVYGFFGASTFSQACILIRNLVKRVDLNSGREELALTLANEAMPLPFAVEYARWIRNLKRSSEAEDTGTQWFQMNVSRKLTGESLRASPPKRR